MKINREARQTAKKYFRACLRPDGSLDEQAVREIVRLLVTEKPRSYIPVLNRLYKLVELAVAERTVVVESAKPLPDDAAGLFTEIENRYGRATRTFYEIKPELIGGVRFRRGSQIWDGTVLGRLQRLKNSFA